MKTISEVKVIVKAEQRNQIIRAVNYSVTAKLGIETECKWRHVDLGMYGCNDYVYQTSCNKEFDATKTDRSKFCPNCGNAVV
jgi:ribosomal protein L33